MANSNSDFFPPLPGDLVLKILVRLPAKSLLRFKLVSKSWRYMISNPHFIKSHLQVSQNNPSVLTVLTSRYTTFVSVNHARSFGESLHLPFPAQLSRMKYVSSYNGIICMRNFGGDAICLVNPLTRLIKILPKSKSQPNISFGIVVGFGFDSVSNDYKVVKIVFIYASYELMRSPVDVVVEIFSTNEDRWREIKGNKKSNVLLLYPYSYAISCGPVVNEVLYFNGKDELILFDLRTEELGLIQTPSLNGGETKSKAFEFEGSVAVMTKTPIGSDTNDISIWTLDDQCDIGTLSWTKKVSFRVWLNLDEEFVHLGNGTIVGSSEESSVLILYDLRNQKNHTVEFVKKSNVRTLIKFTESLVSIKGSKRFI